MIVWVFYGYSLAFTAGATPTSAASRSMFLAGVDVTTMSETFSKGVVIPELVFVVFQMTFACITPALIVGAFAERIKFSAVILFVILWVTFVYFPIAHMVWFWGGPSALCRSDRPDLRLRRDRLRRRHRRPHQCRHRRASSAR